MGFSILKLSRLEENMLYIKNLDLIDQNPVLDINLFIPSIDNQEKDKIGWIKRKF
ncbi:MAG: TrmO family methyltransferase [Candidatus Odinarchaeota archaeon]